jgi:hypothetical protein
VNPPRPSPIITALTRWGALASQDLYKKVQEDFGGERSYQRDLSDIPNLIRLGPKRNRGYAIARNDFPPTPVYMRREDGADVFLGNLLALEADQWTWDDTGSPQRWTLLSQLSTTLPVYQGLPWFMDAFRPAGFLGRTWVREHAAKLGWSLDIQSWTDEQTLTAALQVPWDWRGNLSLGPFHEMENSFISPGERRDEYARRANLVLDGVMVGASADGEQPKFTAIVAEGDNWRPVLVKFSPRMTNDPAARRWGDIMLTEAIAQQVMAIHGLDSAATEIWEHDDRMWLETIRFDRDGAHGRRGMVSLRALANAYSYRGPQNGWVQAAEHLQKEGVLLEENVTKVRHIATIGHLLLNTDMHMGNLSFIVGNGWPHPFRIAPVYDMTPMRWVPVGSQNMVPPLVAEPLFKTLDHEAMVIAAEIWEETSRRDLATDAWREWSLGRAKQIREALAARPS